jgi:cytoplasmic iron level regulating protein YaaA (DUF328/UPF0246 family)
MSRQKRKLLLIACSNRKLRTKGLLPALERYDGVTYRIIRKAMREGYFPPNVDIKILSAEFGLIDASKPIPYYDRRMDRKRADELYSQVSRRLKDLLRRKQYAEIYINMGKVYLLATGKLNETNPKTAVEYAQGGIGEKAQAMKEWIYGD